MAGNLVQGALFTVMVVRAAMLREPAFEEELARQIERSPRFFRNAPVVLDLKGSAEFARAEEFAAARQLLRRHTLSLVGIQNAEPSQVEAAAQSDLASFAPNATQPSRRPVADPAEPAPGPAAAAASPPAAPPSSPPPSPPPLPPRTRLVTQPVRSGTQIYARGADLVVTAAVSPGAELVADGNIHVYGALRGRALAGAAGDVEARIFCSRLEAELVSIAGRYLVSEQLPADQHGSPVQIALVDDQLTVTRN
ncbi:MAG: septum site-determining protein MinC [Alphaproteobacteria bacterium]|nr:septum site-determining protein MinC [Alphaproteobacteria bacterium]MBV9860823.1 septum site-determining protein MinC [Alphaproteobacteria bacterium]